VDRQWVRKIRWFLFIEAVIWMVLLPGVLMRAISYEKADHRLFVPMILAFCLGAARSWHYLRLWVRSRASSPLGATADESAVPLPDRKSLDTHRRSQLMLWCAMIVLTILMYFVGTQYITSAPTASDGIETPFLLVGLALVLVSFFLRNKLRTPFSEARDLLLERRALIFSLIPCEAAAALGVALHSMSTSPLAHVLVLIGISGLVLHYPRRTTDIRVAGQ
jgi:hypothetical protein